MAKNFSFLFYVFFVVFSVSFCWADEDITDKLEDLGIPHKERYPDGEMAYARNIWDMIPYRGRIYLGCGGYDNSPPAANAGPVPVIAFDTKSKKFVTEEKGLPDEQLDNFKIFSDGLLYAPGIDPRQGWELGNFYRRTPNGKWEVVRTMPKGIHNFDMTEFDGKIFCCGYGIAISEDRGKTMVLREMGLKDIRTTAFLRFPKRLFSVRAFNFLVEGEDFVSEMNVYNPKKKDFDAMKISCEELFPDLQKTFVLPNGQRPKPEHRIIFGVSITKTCKYKNRVLYIATRKDHFLFSAENPKGNHFKAVQIPLPENTRAEDLFANKNAVYLLTSSPAEPTAETKEYTNQIWKSKDGVHFKPLFHFRAPQFARSFAVAGKDFYFGLGARYKRDMKTYKWDGAPIPADCGRIYRYKP
ncbi:MAG: hypothetical protein Q4C96_01055 [Planctomycetia bacterium]|nr:hypothetical protein [Planctomycetia bacterium]